MKSLSFRNRIAFYNLISTATIIFGVFVIIYSIVSLSVNRDINNDLAMEIDIHKNQVEIQKGEVRLVDEEEWGEVEHNEININPVFVQVFDKDRNPVEKSPNLKDESLRLIPNKGENDYCNTYLGDIAIRQVQTVLTNKGKTVGYVVIAMSVEAPKKVLENLLYTLFTIFPIILFLLFFLTRYIAGRSIKPALNIINTTSRITNNNFNERIVLPRNKDELYVLSKSINDLLDRIEDAIEREKQFTSDASHELRTPLAVIKGTLEVLIRKPREIQHYEEKIKYCVTEVDRLNNLVDQLLLLARFENQKKIVKAENIVLDEVILQSLQRYSSRIETKKLTIDFKFKEHFRLVSDGYLVSIIIDNLVSNAVKYSKDNGQITIYLKMEQDAISFRISDEGIGIDAKDLSNIYEQFYRSEATEHVEIKGNGLGLSIVKKLCVLLGIGIEIKSEKDCGTTAILYFKKN